MRRLSCRNLRSNMRNGSTIMVRPLWFPCPRPAIPSNPVCEIHQQHNVVKYIHEKHHEFYANWVAVQDDRQLVQSSP